MLLVVLIQLAAIAVFIDTAVSFDSNEYLALSLSLYSSNEYSAPAGLNGFDSFQGEAPSRMRQPLYPLLLVFCYWLPGGYVLPVLLLQVILNCASLAFIYRTAAAVLDKKFKPWSIMFPALYFPWLLLSSKVLSEALFTFLLWAVIYCITLYFKTGGGGERITWREEDFFSDCLFSQSL